MLRAIKNAVLFIVTFFTSIFKFLGSLIKDLFTIAGLLGKAVASIPSYLNFFPAAFTAVVLVLISIAVIYKITGREG